ncbi:MAG: UvrD-helicase domain-containing protein [Anaerolineaceae bacterium]|nr:UvrD-helicase domain-containing protein [Anaerolineaceae bacterium]
MNIEVHPEFEHEQIRLKHTKEAIAEKVRYSSKEELLGGDDWATANLQILYQEKLQSYRESYHDPYFIRIDFHETTNWVSYYFGYRALDLKEFEVLEWRAPIGKLIAINSSELQRIKVPDGFRKGKIKLRRRFQIEKGLLYEINDELDTRDEEQEPGKLVSDDQFLLQQLYSRGDPKLQDIVKTIQKQQDDIIRASSNGIIIINGVAGSGKTSIALHRLAYLLFPGNADSFRAKNSIVFCPNKIFLRYIEDLLPSLGEKDVQQTTFEDWANLQLGRNSGFNAQDTLQDKFLDPDTSNSELKNLWRCTRLKGSLDFKNLLNQHIKHNLSKIDFPKKDWVFNINDNSLPPLVIHIHMDDIYQIVINAQQTNQPLFNQRNLAFNSLKKIILSRVDQNLEAYLKRRIIARLETLLQRYFEKMWPDYDIQAIYQNLLSKPDLLFMAGNGIFTKTQLKILYDHYLKYPVPGIEDIPAFLYLHRRIFGVSTVKYDHIVIDEAQDFSPFQFDLIFDNTRTPSMTIVGDINQGIHAYKGINSWDEVLPDKSINISKENILQSYRATYEIVECSNLILQNTMKEKAILAQSLNRHGEKPCLYKLKDKNKQMNKSLGIIQNLQNSQSFKNIAVITRTKQDTWQLIEYFSKQGIKPTLSYEDMQKEFKYKGGLVVMPTSMTKGLEFEAVIVFDCSEQNFNSKFAYNGRLLYVASTRALHHLSFTFSSQLSKFMNGCQNLTQFQTD